MTQREIDKAASDLRREALRSAVEEVRQACRPVEHVRPVNVDAMGKWLMGRVAA